MRSPGVVGYLEDMSALGGSAEEGSFVLETISKTIDSQTCWMKTDLQKAVQAETARSAEVLERGYSYSTTLSAGRADFGHNKCSPATRADSSADGPIERAAISRSISLSIPTSKDSSVVSSRPVERRWSAGKKSKPGCFMPTLAAWRYIVVDGPCRRPERYGAQRGALGECEQD
ncbi:hypothetical protein CMUS01_15403 [Colletotrichum musicola]|uniref:Uncharacterized protein n=1 Tax=Colletotrichum musicola TaxID=2175873 RepID=A0A8H6IWP4_9PEZI|nr:hypothetical protein CMUS01_15403 [Colletotrichum musicola]